MLPALQKYDNEANRLKYSLFQYPAQDLLYNNLLKATEESKEHLQKQIQRSALNFEDQTFLLLFLDWVLAPNRPDFYLQQTFNERVDEFLKEFPQSKFETFVRSHIRNKRLLETWGWGMEIFSGGGILTGNLQKEYTNVAPLYGYAADVYRRNLALYLRFLIGQSKTKKDKPYTLGVWEEGSKNDVSLLEMSLGYALYDGNRYKITPFAGIGSQEILPNPIKSELEEFELRATTAYILGANLDIKMKNEPTSKLDPVGTFVFWRIRYGYSVPQFASKYPGMSGNMHYINLGLGLVLRNTKKEY